MSENNDEFQQENSQDGEKGKLQKLSCSNCGAPFDLDGNDDNQLENKHLIKCKYCGASHQFAAPPSGAERGEHNYVADQRVLVQWGQRWWKARVLKVVDQQHWLVHYEGWSDNWDEVVGTDRIVARKEKEKTSPAKWIAAVVFLAAVLVAVYFFLPQRPETSPTTPGEIAVSEGSGDKITPSTGQLAAGDKVEVLWNGKWYKAQIIKVETNGHYSIHYEGYDKKWDETVPPNRIRR